MEMKRTCHPCGRAAVDYRAAPQSGQRDGLAPGAFRLEAYAVALVKLGDYECPTARTIRIWLWVA
ncbi:MAG: hypothetical protein KDA75_11165 [Planctomycetaceae bacterium]|nr:hypothetical protein [Planctomycetaceae bacterium]